MNKSSHTRPVKVSVAVITVSSSRSKDTDTSGRTISEHLSAAGIPVRYYTIVPDQVDAIQDAIKSALNLADCVILNGGTGLTHDDYTIEAVLPLLEKRIDGFGELFRLKSYEEIGTAALLSRAVAGTISDKVIFCIPGSTAAVTLAMGEIIIPEIFHIVSHLKV